MMLVLALYLIFTIQVVGGRLTNTKEKFKNNWTLVKNGDSLIFVTDV